MLLDMSFVRDFCRMVLLECANNYFEQVNSEQIEKMQSDLQMPFHYLNLNPQQSILFFQRGAGWRLGSLRTEAVPVYPRNVGSGMLSGRVG